MVVRLCAKLLAGKEGEETVKIFFRHASPFLNGAHDVEDLRTEILVVKLIVETALIDMLFGQKTQHVVHMPFSQGAFQGHDAVAQHDAVAHRRARHALVEEHRVARVEEKCLRVVPRQAEVAPQHLAIQRHLQLMLRPRALRTAGKLLGLARFHFHKQAHIFGHHVEASAQAQFGTEKRCLHQHVLAPLPRFVGAETVAHGGEHVGKLLFKVLEITGCEFFLERGVTECRFCEMLARGAAIDAFEPRGVVGRAVVAQRFCHKLVRGITQENGQRYGRRREARQQEAQRRVAVGAQARGEGGDVNEIVRLEHNLAGDQFAVRALPDVGNAHEVALAHVLHHRFRFRAKANVLPVFREARQAVALYLGHNAAQGGAGGVGGGRGELVDAEQRQFGRHGLARHLLGKMAEASQVLALLVGGAHSFVVQHAVGVVAETVGGFMADAPLAAYGEQQREEVGIVARQLLRLGVAQPFHHADPGGVARRLRCVGIGAGYV